MQSNINKHIKKIQMNNQKGTGVYRKYKTGQQQNSMTQWDSFSRNKQSQLNMSKKQVQDQQWMGSEASPPRPQHVKQNQTTSQLDVHQIFSPSIQKTNRSEQQPLKSPKALIQTILKSLASNGKIQSISPFYSEQSEQKLTEILTNQNKLEAYITQLQEHMLDAEPSIMKNYQMLIILLKQISKSDVEVKHSTKGLELSFNRDIINRQQNQIEKLQKKLKQKDDHIKQIIEEYESVIRNFNDVIQKLLDQRITPQYSHSHQEHNGTPFSKRNLKH